MQNGVPRSLGNIVFFCGWCVTVTVEFGCFLCSLVASSRRDSETRAFLKTQWHNVLWWIWIPCFMLFETLNKQLTSLTKHYDSKDVLTCQSSIVSDLHTCNCSKLPHPVGILNFIQTWREITGLSINFPVHAMFTHSLTYASGKKKARKHKLFGPVLLGRPLECPGNKPGCVPGTNRVCPGDKPGLSLRQSGFVPGTNPGFLLVLHNGSPVCPRDKPSLSLGQSRGRRAADRVYVLNVYVPFLLPNAVLSGYLFFAHGHCGSEP